MSNLNKDTDRVFKQMSEEYADAMNKWMFADSPTAKESMGIKITWKDNLRSKIRDWRSRISLAIEVLKGEHYCDY